MNENKNFPKKQKAIDVRPQGGRERRLESSPPCSFYLAIHDPKTYLSKEQLTKNTEPSGNTPFGTTNHPSG